MSNQGGSMTNKWTRLMILALALPLLIAPYAEAASVHLKFGANSEPSFFDAGLQLSAQGALAGLGNEDVLITLNATGNVAFGVITQTPGTTIAGAPDCPNPQWTETITDLSFTSATLTVEQPVGTVVLTVSCTLSSPTTDGAVSGSIVSCTSQQP